jgi:hypothetical protein
VVVKSEFACSRGAGERSQEAVDVSIAAVIVILIIEETPFLRSLLSISIHAFPQRCPIAFSRFSNLRSLAW